MAWCWENNVQSVKEDGWVEYVSCRNWLHEFCFTYKDKCIDCGKKSLPEKNKMQKRIDSISFIAA
jgi:hypothetical protein